MGYRSSRGVYRRGLGLGSFQWCAYISPHVYMSMRRNTHAHNVYTLARKSFGERNEGCPRCM